MATPLPSECASVSDFNNPLCINVMSNFCSTDDLFGDNYKTKWTGDAFTSTCRRYVELNVGNQVQYVPATDAYVRRYLLTDANPITYPQQGSLIFDPHIEVLVDVCQNYPGGCDAVLGQVCAGYTRADLKENPNLGKLCGCFMSDLEYDKYTGSFGVQKICDPACTLQSAVKPRDPANQFQTLQCGQTICVIDDVKIELLKNTTVGDINFAQACSNCPGGTGGCQCVVSDISITGVESTIGNINFDQNCGGPVNCFQSDANGVPQLVECSALDTGSGTPTSPTSAISTTTLLIIIAVITAIVIIIIIIVALTTRRRGDIPSFIPPSQGLYPSYSAV